MRGARRKLGVPLAHWVISSGARFPGCGPRILRLVFVVLAVLLVNHPLWVNWSPRYCAMLLALDPRLAAIARKTEAQLGIRARMIKPSNGRPYFGRHLLPALIQGTSELA